MSVPSGSDGLIQLLEKANLMCYKDNLLEQGAHCDHAGDLCACHL